MKDIPITNLTELLNNVQKQTNRGGLGSFFCFRGQSDKEHCLVPSVFRDFKDGDNEARKIEQEIYRDFRDRVRGYVLPNVNLNDPLEVLCLAQHYGVPTRLLDWSVNPLAAAYFAVSKLKGTGAIWSLNVTTLHAALTNGRDEYRGIRLSDIDTSADFFSCLVTRPPQNPGQYAGLLIIQPPEIDGRIKNQGGVFSICVPNTNNPMSSFDHEKLIKNYPQKPNAPILRKYTIDEASKKRIKRQLYQMGINANMLFPDMTGLGQFLSDLRTLKVEEVLTPKN